ncbi:MAG: DUF4157 domain-containing protein [Burkholderiales bacterium]|nr:DUF4157 domain-containing protein [Burkholderiales bacterium]
MKQLRQATRSAGAAAGQGRLLQRRCACGTHAMTGECQGCQRARVQRKALVLGRADDALEREADRVAANVTSERAPPMSGREAPALQRASAPPDGALAGDEAPGIVDQVVQSAGRPLDARTRGYFEPRFGRDFSAVRVHTDARAAESARSIQALAYTVGPHVVFGDGQFAPSSRAGRELLGHELAHVIQQDGAGPVAAAVQRKVIVGGAELASKDRKAFLSARKWTSASRADAVMEDMAAAADAFDFKDNLELESEIDKRVSTVSHMEESQATTEKIPGDKRAAFGYPFTGASALYGPRVNYAARDYWEPAVVDAYAVRTDKAKNAQLKAKPRRERCSVYGDPCADYGWRLSKNGRSDPYHAIAYLFAPQPPHKRSLIHCDYLISLVNFMSLADAVGAAEFNKRVAAFGADRIVLKWNAFMDLHAVTLERNPDASWKKDAAGNMKAIWGLGSTQRVRPSSEADLVIGDHVVFFNHLAYDLINERIGNAWRLENAVLVDRGRGKDRFLGHGSGYKTADEMRAKLAEEYNDVARQALRLVAKTQSRDKKANAAALADLTAKFPNVRQVGTDWRAQGVPGLLKDSACPKTVDQKLREIKPSEVIGPKSPCDPAQMNEVERPIESAK